MLRRDKNTHRRGFALYVYHTLIVTHLCSSTIKWIGKPGHPEYIYREIRPKANNPIFVAVVYKPPHASFVESTDFISKLREIPHSYSTNIILSDFNVDHLSDSYETQFICKLIEEKSVFLVPFSAFYHTAHFNTWLNPSRVNALDTVMEFSVFSRTQTPFIAEHYRDFSAMVVTSPNKYLQAQTLSLWRSTMIISLLFS